MIYDLPVHIGSNMREEDVLSRFDTLLTKLDDTLHFQPSRSWYFWYFSVLIFKILTLLILFSSYHQDSGREAPEGGEPDLLRPGLHHQAEVHGGELIIVIFIKIIMMIIIIRWRTSWGSSRSTSSGRRATGCSTMTRREEASGVLLLLLIFLSINFHFSVLSLYWYLVSECL